MKQKKITSTLTLFDDITELSSEIQDLFKAAEQARDKAYAPYSKYYVGTAIQLASGVIVTGSNQENAAYPSGLCAERTALFYTGSQYPDEPIRRMVITVKSKDKKVDQPVPPCGACRQAIAEYEFKQDSKIAIYFSGETGKIAKVDSLKDLLPLAFNSSFV